MVLTRTHKSAVLGAGVGLAALVAGAPALAADNGPGIATPIQSTADLALVSVGNAQSAWLVPGANPTLWTLRGGRPAQVAALPGITPTGLEAGTDATGAPVAVVKSTPGGTQVPSFTLVRLDTGAAAPLTVPGQDGTVEGVAVDSGRVYYSVAGSRSTLRIGRLNGASVTGDEVLRRGRKGERYDEVLADSGRVALTSSVELPGKPGGIEARLPLYVGPAHHLRRVGAGTSSEGGVVRLRAVGFTRRSAIAMHTDAAHEQLTTLRISLATGVSTKLPLTGEASYRGLLNAAWDPASSRLLVSSLVPGPGGGFQLGYSNVLA